MWPSTRTHRAQIAYTTQPRLAQQSAALRKILAGAACMHGSVRTCVACTLAARAHRSLEVPARRLAVPMKTVRSASTPLVGANRALPNGNSGRGDTRAFAHHLPAPGLQSVFHLPADGADCM